MSLEWLTRNFRWKALALFLAVVCHYLITGEVTKERIILSPLSIVPPEGMIEGKQSAESVRLRIVGRSEDVNRLQPDEVKVRIALFGHDSPGLVTVPVLPSNVEAPSGITVMEIRPESVTVSLDRTVEKVLPVKVREEGVPALGYRIAGYEVNPKEVKVTGPQSVLDRQAYIATEPIDVTGLSYSRRLTAVRLEPVAKEATKKRVDILIRVEEEFSRKTFREVPVYVLLDPLLPLSARLTQPKVDIILRGPREVLDKMESKSLEIFVDASGLRPGRYELPPRLAGAPRSVSILEAIPAEIGVELGEVLSEGKAL